MTCMWFLLASQLNSILSVGYMPIVLFNHDEFLIRLCFIGFNIIGDIYPGLLVLGPEMQVGYELARIVKRPGL